tara:strand:- start:46076 stop:46348 length:273 start_codon:yes stop_codon:yes gene_type:complete
MPRFRFTADPNTTVGLHSVGEEGKLLFTGLVVDESKSGFCGCFVREDDFRVGEAYSAKVGMLGVMECEVRWSQRVDEKILKVGFMYRDED